MDEKGFDGINVIPFIDIMLVLLTIVLTTATFIAGGTIPVNLPKAESSATAGRGVTVEINQAGKIWFKGQECGIDHLKAALNNEDRQSPLLIRADRQGGDRQDRCLSRTARGLGRLRRAAAALAGSGRLCLRGGNQAPCRSRQVTFS